MTAAARLMRERHAGDLVVIDDAVIASESEDPSQALQRMLAHGVRRIPVVNDEHYVVGIITLDDMLRVHAEQGNILARIVNDQQSRERRVRR